MVKLEYIWLDGYLPEPNLRSKVKILNQNVDSVKLKDIPLWGFDGSSTKQAEGHFSDCILKPVKLYRHSIIKQTIPTIYVMCEVYNSKGCADVTNTRHYIVDSEDLWVGFEQEYFIRSSHKRPILGLDKHIEQDPQGLYYCGVGGHVYGRELVNEHLDYCLSLGLDITGTNAEVAIGQWEYQVFSKGAKNAGDDLWMARYVLEKLSEKYGYKIELHPKPLIYGDWNGSGLHTNFSNEEMRTKGGKEYFDTIFKYLEKRAAEHIDVYGSENILRLTGKHETQSIDKFSVGVADRGASIRIPNATAEKWLGYLEDRRPASNADPYKIISVLLGTLNMVKVSTVLTEATNNIKN